MNKISWRLIKIFRILIRHGLDEFIFKLDAVRALKFLVFLVPGYWLCDRNVSRGQRLREALEELGPIFVKFGQVLSTRPDLIPPDIAIELTKLQDDVPAFPGEEALKIIENSLGGEIKEFFSSFDVEPIASASIAQVHGATLKNGKSVIVKVLRPGIQAVIDQDVAVLYKLASLADRYWKEAKRLRPIEIIVEYDKTIHDELDMMREGANASQLKNNFIDSDLIYVPAVFWEYSTREILVMERIDGISIRDVDAIRDAGVDLRKLAHDGVEIFFTQAFRDGFFHADMHPGNIFVGKTGQYRAVDFGIMGTLGESDKQYLAENLLAFFNRDYKAVAMAHLRAGWVPSTTRVDEFEAAVRTVCEPIFAKPISDISFGHLVVRLFQVARRFDMEVQPQLVLLQKTLVNIEGLGRQLYPQLDLWETAKPFLEKWMNEQVGPKALLNAVRRELPIILPLLPELPGLFHQFLRNQVDNSVPKLSDPVVAINKSEKKMYSRERFYAGLGTIFLLSSVLLSLGSGILELGITRDIATGALALLGALLVGIFTFRIQKQQ